MQQTHKYLTYAQSVNGTFEWLVWMFVIFTHSKIS